MKKRERAIDSIYNIPYEESDILRFKLFNKVFTLHGETELEEPEIDINPVPAKESRSIHTTETSEDDGSATKSKRSSSSKKSVPSAIFTPSLQQSSIDTIESSNDFNSKAFVDQEEIELRQRLDEEWAVVEASKNLRFEVLKLPVVEKRSRMPASFKPAPLRKGKVLQLRQKVASEAYSILRNSASAPSLFYNPTISRLALPRSVSNSNFTTVHSKIIKKDISGIIDGV